MIAPPTTRTYWVQVFTLKTWQEFLAAGGKVTGFRSARWWRIQQLKPGDFLLCYLSGLGKFVGILEVQSDPYIDQSPIWQGESFPCRADVKIVTALEPEAAVSIRDLSNRLSIFRTSHWGLYLISSPSKWDVNDAEAVMEAIYFAKNQTPR
jgi:hypothetical protein